MVLFFNYFQSTLGKTIKHNTKERTFTINTPATLPQHIRNMFLTCLLTADILFCHSRTNEPKTADHCSLL